MLLAPPPLLVRPIVAAPPALPKQQAALKAERRESVLEENDEHFLRRKVEQDYVLGKKLGEGSYGKVRMGVSRETGQQVAVKTVLKKNARRLATLRREIGIMRTIQHPHIIRFYDVYEDESFLYIVMELCTGGELFDRIVDSGCYTEADAREVTRQILEAVAYLHERNVAHRDLKPENFLYADGRPGAPLKLIDFGLSKRFLEPGEPGGDSEQVTSMKTRVGTPYYIAPEVLKKEYDKACDMWSLGVIVYILLCGYPPFYGESEKQIYEMVRVGKFDFPDEEWGRVSPQAKDLIEKMLIVDPKDRLTAKEALQHPWLFTNRSRPISPLPGGPMLGFPRGTTDSSCASSDGGRAEAEAEEERSGESGGMLHELEDMALGDESMDEKVAAAYAAIDAAAAAAAAATQPTRTPPAPATGAGGPPTPQARTSANSAASANSGNSSGGSAAALTATPPSPIRSYIAPTGSLGHDMLSSQSSQASSQAGSSPRYGASRQGSMRSLGSDLYDDGGEGHLDGKVVARLKRFARMNKLKRAALGVMVRYLKREDIGKLKAQFALIDKDRNGMVSVAEMVQAMRADGHEYSADEMERLMRRLDEDGNGLIDYSDFLAASISKHTYLRDEMLETAFTYFDTAGTGSITVEDLQARLGSEDAHLLKSMLASYDLDKSGAMDIREFKAMMRDSRGGSKDA